VDRIDDMVRWRDRSQTERVELYTVSSLHVLLWFVLVSMAVPIVAEVGTSGAAPIAAATLATGLVGVWCLQRAIRTYPEPRRPWLPLTVLGLGCLGVALLARRLPEPVDVTGGLVAALLLSWCAGGFPGRRWAWVVVASSGALLWVAGDELGVVVPGLLAGGFFVFTVQVSLWMVDVVRRLDRTRDTEAALAVAEERLRFSHDVHDVLGRRLSTIGVQAELAAAYVDRSDARAADQIRTVRQTAHEGLREAREIARGYRPLDLDHEVDGALALLQSAGIAARAELGDVPVQRHEPAARTIREAVTNVLRHSRARTVTMTYADDELVIRNDGAHRAAGGGGSGLRALAEHVSAAGGRLETERDGDEFVVRARFDTGAVDPS
jgi:two-component system, NarL family, sensor histidine kinase DesK